MIGNNRGIRVKFVLKYRGNPPYILPYNYKHNLQAIFYSFVRKADNLYAHFLHDKGFKVGTKIFKYFTFSDIRIPGKQYKRMHKGLVVFSDTAELYFSTFVEETALSVFNGMFGEDIILTGEGEKKISYNIFKVDILSPIEFNTKMKFRLLSPLALKYRNKPLYVDNYEDNKEEFASLIKDNLIHKYEGLRGEVVPQKDFHFSFRFLSKPGRHISPKKIYFLKPGGKRIGIRCFLYPFLIEAPEDLIEVGYYTGFGVSNAMGFGMAEVLDDRGYLNK